MRKEKVSLRGKVVRDMMKNMMDSAMGHKFQTGEYRANPVEPAWICRQITIMKLLSWGTARWNIFGPPVFYRQSDSAASWGRLYWSHEKHVSGFCHAVFQAESGRRCADGGLPGCAQVSFSGGVGRCGGCLWPAFGGTPLCCRENHCGRRFCRGRSGSGPCFVPSGSRTSHARWNGFDVSVDGSDGQRGSYETNYEKDPLIWKYEGEF